MANKVLFEDAPAKVNLALHVTGQRADGFHLLESLVVFTKFGDRISGSISDKNNLSITGPFSTEMNACEPSDNLIYKARTALADFALAHGISTPPIALTCEKNLPVASGLGGGSADAAATLRLLIKIWQLDIAETDLTAIALKLGADVPMCLSSIPLIAKGIGEGIDVVSNLPQFALVLANPLIEVSTPGIFSKLKSKSNPGFDHVEVPCGLDDFLSVLNGYRNDLQEPAIDVAPEIEQCLDALCSTKPLFHRMSGSGASCFGIYKNMESAQVAYHLVKSQYPNWFTTATPLRGS
ncbi:4-(cytidine 5'-diphospho)-2-C-methyl-D-erythritol kinase [Lentilitoribacter sp. Alg239-R112]|uniref:4-(cytidine 5'-diphospho)-2-C-methyl-D-erythritol kinase n=1 Tax=Lentilitoribacter sp. Alg239-R112 TaxID=2305987 RepID=UPI0013A6C1A7|nr:4-(cytidine 5'-diphospho)-2-C-methyl-D-erythritol kinase [Lentilitoribacter sp. Alg239-R112]